MKSALRARQTGLATLGIPLDLAPMEAKLVSELPKDAGWYPLKEPRLSATTRT